MSTVSCGDGQVATRTHEGFCPWAYLFNIFINDS